MTSVQHSAWSRRRPRGTVDAEAVRRLATAIRAVDRSGIRAALCSDVVLVVDGGGTVPDPSIAVEGHDAASAHLMTLTAGGASVAMASINSLPGLVLVRDGVVVAALSVETRARLLSTVWVVSNPDKLRHWNRSAEG